MPRLIVGGPQQDTRVGRLLSAAGVTGISHPYGLPERLTIASDDMATGVCSEGFVRAGRPTDVKPGCHWLLVPNSQGSFDLRPVDGWYEFAKPAPQSVIAAPPKAGTVSSAGQDSEAVLDNAMACVRKVLGSTLPVAEWMAQLAASLVPLQRESGKLRAALEAHGGWNGRQFEQSPDLHGLLATIQSKTQKHAAAAEAEKRKEAEMAAAAAEKTKGKKPKIEGEAEIRKDAAVRKEQAERWEKMLERRSSRAGTREKLLRGDILTAVALPKVAYPEDDRLKDETGLNKQKNKKKKQLKKEQGAVENAEDDDVVTSANALHSLKNQRGEGGWDFEDGEAYSDDEAEEIGFDDQLQQPEEAEPVPSADEDEPEGEKGDLLSGHGQELEVLLEQYGEEGAGPDGKTLNDADAGGEDGEESEGERCAKRQRIAADDDDEPDVNNAAASGPAGAATAAPGARGPPQAVPPAPAKPAPKPFNLETATDDDLRSKVISSIKAAGGHCTLLGVAKALGLTNKGSPIYQRAVNVIKEVAVKKEIPGEGRPVLVLKPEFAK